MEKPHNNHQQDIAIIGMSGQLPGANTAEEYWQLLANQGDAIGCVPQNRWDAERLLGKPKTPGKVVNREGGFIHNIDQFDSDFFSIAPTEAAILDPQQRVLLEWSWQALEQAAIDPSTLKGSNTGVFIGASNTDYVELQKRLGVGDGPHVLSGGDLSILPNRISYTFAFKGPSLVINTYCSSSLVALHIACDSLKRQETHLALVGGINLMLLPNTAIVLSQIGAMSPSGRCKTFDKQADGYVRSEGGGIFILKRLNDAIEDGDKILAVVKGTAVNQDGRSNGITAPNGLAQETLLQTAHQNAGVSPDEISFIECHGTGTPLGDPIEINAIKSVFVPGRDSNNPCWLGAAKANVGHLEPAAGVAGLMKLILMLQHQKMPGQPHLTSINPRIKLENTPLHIATETQDWCSPQHSLRTAGISGFSMGGVNAHAIIQQAPSINQPLSSRDCHSYLLTFSAQTPKALKQLAQQHADALDTIEDNKALASYCFTANTGRKKFHCALAIVEENSHAIRQQLLNYINTEETDSVSSWSSSQVQRPPKQVWLFTGQGSQYIGMAYELYQNEPVFRAALDSCNEILQNYLDTPLLSLLYKNDSDKLDLLHQTAYTQPTLFSLEYALAKLWQSYGLQADILLGHSLGEYVAACIAEVFSLEDALKLVSARGQLMLKHCKPGAMLAVNSTVEDIKNTLKQHHSPLTFAAFNNAHLQVLSGTQDAVDNVVAIFKEQGVHCRQLQVSHAFHSSMMEAMLPEFSKVLATISFNKPRSMIISNLNAEFIGDEIASPEYWLQHICRPVKFYQSMQAIIAEDNLLFLEVGPKPTLCSLGQQIDESPTSRNHTWLSSLNTTDDDTSLLHKNLAQMYCAGIKNFNLVALYKDIKTQSFHTQHQYLNKLSLPSYPFQKQRYWFSDNQEYAQHIGWNELAYLTKQYRGTANVWQETSIENQPTFSLLGHPLSLANSATTYFNAHINIEQFAFFNDNKRNQKILFPESAYLDILFSLTKHLEGSYNQLENIRLQQPLYWQDNLQIQTRVDNGSDVREIEIWAKTAENNHWICHVTAQLTITQELSTDHLSTDLCHDHQDNNIDEYYLWLDKLGINIGPFFQGIKQLLLSESHIIAEVGLPKKIAENKYQNQQNSQPHPALLSSALHSAFALAKNHIEADNTLRLVSIGRAVFNIDQDHHLDNLSVKCELNSLHNKKNSFLFTLLLFDNNKQAVASFYDVKVIIEKYQANAGSEDDLNNSTAKISNEQQTIEEGSLLHDIITLNDLNKSPDLQQKLYEYLMDMVSIVTKTSKQKLADKQRPFLTRSFVDMGFDSLMAMELRSRVQKDLSIDIPLKDLFDGLIVEQAIDKIHQQLQLAKLVKTSSTNNTELAADSHSEASIKEVLVL